MNLKLKRSIPDLKTREQKSHILFRCIGCNNLFRSTYETLITVYEPYGKFEYDLGSNWCDICIRQEISDPGSTIIMKVYSRQYTELDIYKPISASNPSNLLQRAAEDFKRVSRYAKVQGDFNLICNTYPLKVKVGATRTDLENWDNAPIWVKARFVWNGLKLRVKNLLRITRY